MTWSPGPEWSGPIIFWTHPTWFFPFSLYSRNSGYSTSNGNTAFNHDAFKAHFLPLNMMTFISQSSPALNLYRQSSICQQKSSSHHSSEACSPSRPLLHKPGYLRLEPKVLKTVVSQQRSQDTASQESKWFSLQSSFHQRHMCSHPTQSASVKCSSCQYFSQIQAGKHTEQIYQHNPSITCAEFTVGYQMLFIKAEESL